MSRKKLKQKVLKISEGIFSTLIDLVLGEIFFGIEFILDYERYRIGPTIDKAIAKSNEDLEKINYKSIKRTLNKLKQRGLIDYLVEEGINKPILTTQGKKRLKEILPTYIKSRPWNGKLYFVFYDLPESTRYIRDTFRNYLGKLGARMLQRSVYLIWYDPTDVLCQFIEKHNLEGLVIISCLGKDGYISGVKEIKDWVARVYKLEELNGRYQEFIAKYSEVSKTIPPSKIAFEFLSILGGDPQLPFELLPENWAGEQAYYLYKKLTKPKK